MSFFDMTNLDVYKLPCNCNGCSEILELQGPIKPTDLNPKTGLPPKHQNIGRYFWVCNNVINNKPCKFYRFFDLKWPKYIKENPISNQENPISDKEFKKEFDVIVNSLSQVSFQMVDANTKILLKGKLEDLITKLNSSIEIPKNKCTEYINLTSQFMNLLEN
jgi:hypothetical protein